MASGLGHSGMTPSAGEPRPSGRSLLRMFLDVSADFAEDYRRSDGGEALQASLTPYSPLPPFSGV